MVIGSKIYENDVLFSNLQQLTPALMSFASDIESAIMGMSRLKCLLCSIISWYCVVSKLLGSSVLWLSNFDNKFLNP